MNPEKATALDAYVSVDVEAAGPVPSLYSLLSIGACRVCPPRETFYVELKPIHDTGLPEAMAIAGLSLEGLRERGLEPAEAMRRFDAWLVQVVPAGQHPVMVAFNAPFDWMFVADYFHRFLGRNPFGHTALDIKALYMGLTGSSWSDTRMRYVAPRFLGKEQLSHHALQDALDQAELLSNLLKACTEAREKKNDPKNRE